MRRRDSWSEERSPAHESGRPKTRKFIFYHSINVALQMGTPPLGVYTD
jgi:hypothetical protein